MKTASAILLPLLCAAVSAVAAAAADPEPTGPDAGVAGSACRGGNHSFNAVLPAATNAIPNAWFVRAADLRCNPDRIHFDTPSQRTLGLRYAEAFLKATETTASDRPQPRSGGADR